MINIHKLIRTITPKEKKLIKILVEFLKLIATVSLTLKKIILPLKCLTPTSWLTLRYKEPYYEDRYSRDYTDSYYDERYYRDMTTDR